jgi:hypothetical protein
MTELKPCPNPDCGGDDDVHLSPGVRDQYTHVYCMSCEMCGPMNDPTGAKWNALPRGDAFWLIQEFVRRLVVLGLANRSLCIDLATNVFMDWQEGKIKLDAGEKENV